MDIYNCHAHIFTSERQFGINLRAALGEADFWQIAYTNPRRFLFSDESRLRATGMGI